MTRPTATCFFAPDTTKRFFFMLEICVYKSRGLATFVLCGKYVTTHAHPSAFPPRIAPMYVRNTVAEANPAVPAGTGRFAAFEDDDEDDDDDGHGDDDSHTPGVQVEVEGILSDADFD